MPINSSINILCLGDIVGHPGRDILENELKNIQKEYSIDFTVANIENSAAGFGFSNKIYYELVNLKIDAFTSGNHVYAKREVMDKFDVYDKLVRPINFNKRHPGKGIREFDHNGLKISIINLMGRVFMPQLVNCPFTVMDEVLKNVNSDIIIVDFHAETTSEKQAMGWYLKDKVTLVFGTHTHVQTSDCKLLSNKTAYVSDIGMCGAYDSVIGMDRDISINKFIDQLPSRHQPVKNPKQFVIGAVIIEVDPKSFHVKDTKLIHEVFNNE